MATPTAVPPSPERLSKWVEWLAEIRRHLMWIHHHRELWSEVRDAAQARPDEAGGTWLRHYGVLYAEAQIMGVRRVVRGDVDKGHVALTTLLWDMEKNPMVITADWIEARALNVAGIDDAVWYARRERDRFIERWCLGDPHLSPRKIKRDRDRLMQDHRKVIDWADRSIAHISPPDEPSPVPTFGELDATVDDVSDLFIDYAALLTHSHYVLKPVIQDNWKQLFERPLFEQPKWRE